jgi:hypothetical protein
MLLPTGLSEAGEVVKAVPECHVSHGHSMVAATDEVQPTRRYVNGEHLRCW